VDWRKVDAPLASALAGAPDDESFPVFVHLDPSRADAEILDQLGLEHDDDREIESASLSAAQLAVLTDQPWVQRVRLGGRLRLLRPPSLAQRKARPVDER
jgi:hypothetical protein